MKILDQVDHLGAVIDRWRRGRAEFDWTSISWCIIAAIIPIERTINGLIDLGGYSVQMAVIALGVVSFAFRKVALPPWPWLWGVALVLLPVGGLLSAAGDNRFASFAMAGMFALYLLVTAFSLAYQARIRTARIGMALGFLVVHTLSLGVGLAQAAGFAPFGLASRGGRINGLATHPNVVSFMAVIAIFICLAFMATRRVYWYIVGGVIIIANLIAIILAKSLSVILAVAVAMIAWACLKRVLRWAIGIALGGAAVVALVVLVIRIDISGAVESVSQRINDVLEGPAGQRGSWQMRTDTYAYAWEHIKESPISGVGVDSKFAVTGDGKTVVHNFFLHSWYQGGILFAVFAIAMLALISFVAWRAYRTRSYASEVSVLVFMVVFGATSAMFLTNEYWFVILACLCFAKNVVAEAESGGMRSEISPGHSGPGSQVSDEPASASNSGPMSPNLTVLTRRDYWRGKRYRD